MKVLLSAIACDPGRGSESHFGWTALRAISREHEVWVIGHANDQKNLMEAQRRGDIPGTVRFAFHAGCRSRSANRIIARFQNWQEFHEWNRQAMSTALRWEREVGFDVIHHVTLASWRVSSPLWKLGKPFVWGPLGGGERFPPHLAGTLSPASKIYETIRAVQGSWASRTAAVRACAREATVVLAANPETGCLLSKLRGTGAVPILSPAHFGLLEIRRFSALAARRKTLIPGSPLLCFAGGDIEGRKGIAMAIDAIARLAKDGTDIRYQIAGSGPELDFLRRRAETAGLGNKVSFSPYLDSAAYEMALAGSHVYLLPSLRDSAGLTLMEAMLAGLPPIIAECGGPGLVVPPEAGWKIPVASYEKMVANLGAALCEAANHPQILSHKAQNAVSTVVRNFSESAFLARINDFYHKAVEDWHERRLGG